MLKILVKKNIIDMMPEDKHADYAALTQRLQSGATVQAFQTQRHTKDGRLLDICLTAIPLPDKDGRPDSFATTEIVMAKKEP